MDKNSLLKKGLEYWGISINEEQNKKFDEYIFEIKAWNKKINITSITDDREIIIKHFLDSISSCKIINYENKKVIDIGTGAGFPGIPLKIIFPSMRLTLLDSSFKKTEVLKKICEKLNIIDCNIINNNVEKTGMEIAYRESFDLAITRAVSKLSVLLEYGIPLLKTNGNMVIYKGKETDAEVENAEEALNKLNSEIIKNHYFSLPFSDYERRIIIVEKLGKTPDKYPRQIGIPKKRPL